MKRLLTLFFVLASVMAVRAATLQIGDEYFSSKDGAMQFQKCNAYATFNTASGFSVTFSGDSFISGGISILLGGDSAHDLTINLKYGSTLTIMPETKGDARILAVNGGLTIQGLGTLTITDGYIYGADYVKLIGTSVNIAQTTGGHVAIHAPSAPIIIGASFVSVAGRGMLMYGQDITMTGSMVNLVQVDSSSSSDAAVEAWFGSGNNFIKIVGCVVTLLANDDDSGGFECSKNLLVGESCVVVRSKQSCFSSKYEAAFQDSRVLAVSADKYAVSTYTTYGSPSKWVNGNLCTAFFGDGKYVLGSGSGKQAISAGKVEIDDGKLEVSAPSTAGALCWDFEMKDGSLEMVDEISFKNCYEEILTQAAIEAVVAKSGVFGSWTGMHTTMLASMIEKLAASIGDVPSGSADAAVCANTFVQSGGSIKQGSAKSGCVMTGMGSYSATIPAFVGGEFNGLFQQSGNGGTDEYYDISPTNALGKKLTHVAYSPYWVYVKQKITVTFDPNGGTVSPLSRTCTEDSAYGTLPTPARAGAEFVGWYDGTKKVLKSTVIEQGRGDHVLVARWELRPDLVVTASLSPSVITKSETTKITYTVKNVGLAAADASSVEILVGNASWRRSVSALAAGASYSETVTLNGSIFAAGTFAVKVTADIGAKVTESDETNNEVSLGTLTVVRNPVNSNYDLQYKKRASSDPSEAWLSSSLTGTKAETTFKLGDPIYIQLGFWNAKQVRISGWIYVRADLVKSTGSSIGYYTWSWQGLNKNATGYLTDTYRNPAMLQNLKEGSYALTLTLDSNDYYSETDEANNIRQINFSVYDPTPKPTTYTIEFKANGGSGTMTSMTCSPDCVYGLSKSCFTKTNKRFAGWACSNGNRYDDGVLVFNLAEPGETVTMTAIWE